MFQNLIVIIINIVGAISVCMISLLLIEWSYNSRLTPFPPRCLTEEEEKALLEFKKKLINDEEFRRDFEVKQHPSYSIKMTKEEIDQLQEEIDQFPEIKFNFVRMTKKEINQLKREVEKDEKDE